MPKTETTTALVTIKKTTPILDVINKSLMTVFKKKLAEITTDINKGIEAGVGTESLLRDANAYVQNGRKALKIVNEARLAFTRPIDAAKKEIMKEIESTLFPTAEAVKKLDSMVMTRAAEIKAEEEKARREHEEAVRAAEEAARKREETNKKISLAKGGTGEVATVEPETIEKIEAAVKAGTREIAGVAIWQEWIFAIEDSKKVPPEYRKDVRR
jgi:hypothetical protein